MGTHISYTTFPFLIVDTDATNQTQGTGKLGLCAANALIDTT